MATIIEGSLAVHVRSSIFVIAAILYAGSAVAQQAQTPQAATGQPAPAQGQQQEQGDNRQGGPRWQYQSEETQPRTYTQPGYAPSIPLEVEQLRNRVAALEDRAEKLETTLKAAIEVINAQTESIRKLSGN